eukprot:gene23105-biopygen19307
MFGTRTKSQTKSGTPPSGFRTSSQVLGSRRGESAQANLSRAAGAAQLGKLTRCRRRRLQALQQKQGKAVRQASLTENTAPWARRFCAFMVAISKYSATSILILCLLQLCWAGVVHNPRSINLGWNFVTQGTWGCAAGTNGGKGGAAGAAFAERQIPRFGQKLARTSSQV